MKAFATTLSSICLLVAGPAAARDRMAGFDEIAGGGDTIEVTTPTWMRGKVRIGGEVVGSVRRRALGSGEAFGLSGVQIGGMARYGRWSFDLRGPAVGGGLSGDCLYDRTERRVTIGALRVSEPRVPLLLQCVLSRDGAEIGMLELKAAPPSGALVQPTRRVGVVRVGAEELNIVAVHKMAGSPIPTDMPVGYTFAAERRAVAAVDLTGFKRRRVVLPRDLARRDAARAAAIALALFWDPGDTDD